MGKVKESIQQVFDKCYQIYQAQGYPAVIDHVNDMKALGKPEYEDILDEHCKECDNEMPALNHTCLVCGCATTEIIKSKIPEFIQKVDWELLRDQKEHLISLNIGDPGLDLDGIINLIDSFQDYAVDVLGVDDKLVFNSENDELLDYRSDKLDTETDEQYFARVNAETIWYMHIEGTFLYENEDMPEEFIKGIVDTPEHAEKIKKLIYDSILVDVVKYPKTFKKDDRGNFTYDPEMYDYGFAIEDYCKKIFNQDKTKQVLVCSNCGSQNVEIKKWYNPNTNEIGVDCEDDAYCNNCEGHHKLDLKEIPIE